MKKFKLDRKCVFFSIISLMIVSLFAFGSASWTMAITKDFGTGTINKVDLDEGRVVAYINENTEANQYRSVELALAKANAAGSGTVYVIPTADGTECQPVHIKCDVAIKNGVTLALPYNGTTIEAADDASGRSSGFADGSTANIKKYRRTQLIINKNVSMTVESGGTLSIGGVTGHEGAQYAGIVSGDYAELSMERDSQLVNNGGTINCYGYIKEYGSLNNGSLITLNSGIMICPLAIYDYQGGAATMQMMNNGTSDKVCPFTSFDLANNQVKIKVFASAFLKVKTSLFVSGAKIPIFGTVGEGFYPTEDADRIITMIGDSASKTILQLSSGFIEMKYTPNSIGLTTGENDNTKTSFFVHGTVNIGSFSLTIKVLTFGKTLNTTELFFPISWRLFFELCNGSDVTFGQKIKFLPGSSLIINEGATLNVTSQTVFYPKTSIFTTLPTHYSENEDAAKLICDGTINVTGSFGGTISNSKQSGVINYNSTNYNVSSKEPSGKTCGASNAVLGTKMDVTSTTYNAAYVSDSSGSTTNITSSGTYKSQGTYFAKQ